MKIDFNAPPEWLICSCYRCVAMRITIVGSPFVPVCNKCGEMLVAKIEGLLTRLENCPICEKEK